MECLIYQTVRTLDISHTRIKSVVSFVFRSLHEKVDMVSIHCIGDQRMRTLNKQYRGIDKTTDVLSFAAEEGVVFGSEREIGDIFISVPKIRRQARKYGVPYHEEFFRMLIHGILHSLGYDHIKPRDAKEMFRLQEKFLSRFV